MDAPQSGLHFSCSDHRTRGGLDDTIRSFVSAAVGSIGACLLERETLNRGHDDIVVGSGCEVVGSQGAFRLFVTCLMQKSKQRGLSVSRHVDVTGISQVRFLC